MLSCAKSEKSPTLQTCAVRVKGYSLFSAWCFIISDVVILMAEASLNSSSETPIKSLASSSSGCPVFLLNSNLIHEKEQV